MQKLGEFCRLADAFAARADFMVVYVAEAHPAEVWPAPGGLLVHSHQNLHERRSAAHMLLREAPLRSCRVVADAMDDNANLAYGVAFERLAVIQDGQIVFLGGKGPFSYRVSDVGSFLETFFA